MSGNRVWIACRSHEHDKACGDQPNYYRCVEIYHILDIQDNAKRFKLWISSSGNTTPTGWPGADAGNPKFYCSLAEMKEKNVRTYYFDRPRTDSDRFDPNLPRGWR